MKKIRAYHFVSGTLRDGRPVPANGQKLIHPGKPVLCESGLHASVHPFDALRYAPGNTLCLVECGGTIIEGDDKLVCTERTIMKRIDAEPLVRRFAADCALSLDHLWDMPDLVREYLETLNPDLRVAARAAACAVWATADAADAARNAADAARNAEEKRQRRNFKKLVKEAFDNPINK